MNVAGYINSFLDSIIAEKTASKNTVESYRRDLESLPSAVLSSAPENVTTKDLQKYLSNNSDFKVATISRKISCFRQFFHFLASEEIIKDNPARALIFPKKESRLPKFLTQEEIGLIVEEAKKDNDLKGVRVIALIELLKGSGLRVSELISLKKNSVQNFNDGGVNKKYLIVKGKGGKERIAPLTNSSVAALNEYLKFLELDEKNKKSVYLFPSRSASGFITRQQAANLIKEYALKAGIEAKKISPHVLRHSFATNLIEKGMDIRVLQEILGHSDISTTQIYTHTNTQKLKNFVEKNHPMAKKGK